MLLVLLALTPFGKVKGQYCSAASVTETCNSSQILNSTNFIPWEYFWFETDALGGNRLPLNNGLPTNYLTVTPTQTINDETHYYIEEGHRPVIPYLTCTSGVKTVKFIYELKIVSNNLNPPVYSISNTSSIVYSNFQWYRNGVAIVGAISNNYTPTISGDYYMTANSTCGNRTSNTIAFCANNTYPKNYKFLAGITNINNSNLVFDGTVTIPEDAIVNISNSTIYMKQDAEIVVDMAVANNGGKLNMTNCSISSCGTWHGIIVAGADSSNKGVAQSATCSLSYVAISKADLALYAFHNPVLAINACTFTNNYRHIQIERCAGAGAVNTYIQNCDFNPLMVTAPTFSNYPKYPHYVGQYLGLRPFVFLCEAKKFHFVSNNFVCVNPPATYNQVAIIGYAPSSATYNELAIDQNHIDGDFYSGIIAANLGNLNVSNSTYIHGDVYEGIVCNNVEVVGVYNTDIRNTTANKGNTGIRVTNPGTSINLENNFIKNFVNGIEYYNNQAGVAGAIFHNSIISNTYGIVIAPDCHPVTGGCGTNSSHYSNPNALLMYCNKVLGNYWGVIGAGDIINQGSLLGDEWGTFFGYGWGVSTSISADVVWYSSLPVQFYVYDSAGSYFTPKWVNANATISLDGNSISSGGGSVAGFPTSPNAFCRASYKTDPVNIEKLNSNSPFVEVYPNPFNSEINVKNNSSKAISVYVLDMAGRAILNSLCKNADIVTVNTASLPTGLYIVKILDSTTGELIGIQKLVKTTN